MIGKSAGENGDTHSSSSNLQEKIIKPSNSHLHFLKEHSALNRTLDAMTWVKGLQTREDFTAGIASLIHESDKVEKERLLALLFERWLEVSPTEALDEVRQIEMFRAHGWRVALAFENWSETHPAEASALLQKAFVEEESLYLDRVDPPGFMLSLFAGLARKDPHLASSLLTKAPESKIRQQSLDNLLQTWFGSSSTEALKWVEQITPDHKKLRQQAIETASTRAGLAEDPRAGIDWAQDLPSPQERSLALTNISTQWSQRDVRSAFAWASTLPDNATRFALMPTVIRRLAIIDPGQAADWLNQHDPSPKMDQSIVAYIQAIQRVNPQAAKGSAASISDPQLRAQIEAELAQN